MFVSERITLFRIEGEDGRGNVHFTSYYTPVLEARRERDNTFRYPIYRKPSKWESGRPTRAMIDGENVLNGLGLEIAWTSDLLENYFLQVQGSGYLQFEDGSSILLLFRGQNGYAYTSIGNYLVRNGYIEAADISLPSIRTWFEKYPDSLESVLYRNESYTFFEPFEDVPKGAANTILVAGHSIAVDPKFIPYGAVLLAKVPILDQDGVLLSHEYRLLTAQDRGGAIKGPGHVDVYAGVGKEAERKAGSLHHYGS